jgi:hypothetical protein
MADTIKLSADKIAEYIRNLFVANNIIPYDDSSFKNQFIELGQNVPNELMNDFDVIAAYVNNTPTMKPLSQRISIKFKGIDLFRKNFPDKTPPSYKEYSSIIKSVDSVLKTYNATELATEDSDFYSNLIGNGVDPEEFQLRMTDAVDRVLNADDVLKAELVKTFPGASLEKIAHSMLLGKDKGSKYLERVVNQAEVRAEFGAVGLTPASDVVSVADLGLSRAKLAQGAQSISQNLKDAQDYSRAFGLGEITQAELESEAFKGIPSERRAKLNALRQAQFSGTSGVGSTSFTQRRAGQL